MGFSFVLLLIVELVLRLIGYGPVLDFVVTRLDKGKTQIMGINPEAYKRYHLNLRRLRGADKPFALWREFVQPKPANGFRVFFLGESSVQGFPHTPNAAAPAFLELMLQDAWPDRSVEVINCGVAAINSFSLRQWAVEVLDYQPDLLVVYAGHNEFYGAPGPGSSGSLGTNRCAILFNLALRELRLAQAVEDLVNLVRAPPASGRAGGLMAVLAQGQLIALDSSTYRGCRANFRANLEDIARAAREAKVPLVLCSLVSNEKDLVPMTSLHRQGLTPEQQKTWQAHFDAGLAADKAWEWRRAIDIYQEAARIDDTHAELIYRLAQTQEHLGAYDEARSLYRRARDLDALRFRATAEFSDVIRDVADRDQTLFVDVLPHFESASPQGLIGYNLMTDHLHPTIEGHYLLAKTVCTALANWNQPWPKMDASTLPAFGEAAERLGIDHTSEMFSKIMIFMLTEGFPFADTPNAELHQRLGREISQWRASLHEPEAAAIGTWLQGKGQGRELPHYHIAKVYLNHGDVAKARKYFRAAELASEPHSLSAARAKAGTAQAQWAAARVAGGDVNEARSVIADTQAYVRDCLLIHPQAQAEFSKIKAELEAILKGTP